MVYNKIVYGGKTLIDLTGDTVTPDKMLEGVQAHRADGSIITGTIQSDQVIPLNTTEHSITRTIKDSDGNTIEDSDGSIVNGKNVYRLM